MEINIYAQIFLQLQRLCFEVEKTLKIRFVKSMVFIQALYDG